MKRILIIDNSTDNLQFMENVLNDRYKLVLEKSGEEALSFLEKNKVDLLVLDVFMPKMNGLETLRVIRNRQFETDAIMVTAANDRESLEEALHLGVVDYLIKPFTYERFQLALNKYITQCKVLKDNEKFNQKSIDNIIDNIRSSSTVSFPKGIQE